jgi:aspartyl-tRNA(Asn)/glutamyl-tRNA(Gln) amidotransferase subunit C
MSNSHGVPALDLDSVRKVARLARLELSDEALVRYHRELGSVLKYAQRLQQLELASIEPLASPLDQRGPLMPDEPGAVLPAEKLLQMAPDRFEQFVKVPKVMGEGSA